MTNVKMEIHSNALQNSFLSKEFVPFLILEHTGFYIYFLEIFSLSFIMGTANLFCVTYLYLFYDPYTEGPFSGTVSCNPVFSRLILPLSSKLHPTTWGR